MIVVRKIEYNDIEAVAELHASVFPRQTLSKEWITCNFNAYPRIQYYLAVHENKIIGFIEWLQKSGFRKEAVVELEQIGIKPDQQGKGAGRILIAESLKLLSAELSTRDASIKHIIVTTRADNYAQKLYKSALKAEVEATISNLYSADEVLMIARNVLI